MIQEALEGRSSRAILLWYCMGVLFVGMPVLALTLMYDVTTVFQFTPLFAFFFVALTFTAHRVIAMSSVPDANAVAVSSPADVTSRDAVIVKCPRCETALKLQRKWEGSVVRCPKCRHLFKTPSFISEEGNAQPTGAGEECHAEWQNELWKDRQWKGI